MLVFVALVLLGCLSGGTRAVKSPERPVAPNVTAINTTEMTITWCRVNSNNVEINYYELYVDGALEYRGLDISYTAKRLKPWTWYKVTLRACGFFPGSCSPHSLPVLATTLRHSENVTAVIWKGASLVKVLALPTYAFVLGVVVGVVMLSLGMLWRYFHTTDWMASTPFEELLKSPEKENLDIYTGFSHTWAVDMGENNGLVTNTQLDPALLESGKITGVCHPTKTPPTISPAAYLSAASMAQYAQHNWDTIWRGREHWRIEEVESGELYPVVHLSKGYETQCPLCEDKQTETEQVSEAAASESNYSSEKRQTLCSKGIMTSELHQSSCLYGGTPEESHTTITDIQNLSDCSKHGQESYTKTPVLKEVTLSPDAEREGIVVAIDNSNIYIGAQECASALNIGERKRNVRLKIQNLVRILEQNRPKVQGFACGSSPPATEQVWEVYRRLGYTVDLEDRRGKDEQRVDEALHLSIYKALCELSPRVLVLATGDGMKGKSEQGTSFPGCAASALEQGWVVELHSWKHSLSTEWNKLARRYPERLKIFCLDKFVNHITFVDGKNGRKSLHVPADFTM